MSTAPDHAGAKPDPAPPERPRRDFLTTAACTFASVGAAATLWPIVHQMNPHRGSEIPAAPEVDLAAIAPGAMVTVAWRGQPVVVRHRTPDDIARARSVPLASLPDPIARNAMRSPRAPATDDNRTISGRPDWLVVIAVCTHLGCLLKSNAGIERNEEAGGWFCPCHAARFDAAGRVRSGPAATNLPVPPYRFLNPTRLQIGRA